MNTPFKDGDYYILVKKEWLTDKSVANPYWLGAMKHDAFTNELRDAAFCRMKTEFENAACRAYNLIPILAKITTCITIMGEA